MARDIRITGPIDFYGKLYFFIQDTFDNVWDGTVWRGIGMPYLYSDFKSAFGAAGALSAQEGE